MKRLRTLFRLILLAVTLFYLCSWLQPIFETLFNFEMSPNRSCNVQSPIPVFEDTLVKPHLFSPDLVKGLWRTTLIPGLVIKLTLYKCTSNDKLINTKLCHFVDYCAHVQQHRQGLLSIYYPWNLMTSNHSSEKRVSAPSNTRLPLNRYACESHGGFPRSRGINSIKTDSFWRHYSFFRL